MELERYSPVKCVGMLLSVTLSLQAAVVDGRGSLFVDSVPKPAPDLPFVHSVAENSSFRNYLRGSVPGIFHEAEKNAKRLMKNRYEFDGAIKISDYWKDLSSEASSAEKLNGSVYFLDGWAEGFPNISLDGKKQVNYDGYTIKIRSDVIVWKHMVFSYDYKLIEDCQELKGQIQKEVNDARYYVTIELDVASNEIRLFKLKRHAVGRLAGEWLESTSPPVESSEDPDQECDHLEVLPSSSTECYVAGDIHVNEFKGNSRQKTALVSVFTDFYRGTVFPEVEAVLQTILEDSLKDINLAGHIPKLDYTYGGPESGVKGEDLTVCSLDVLETPEDQDILRLEPVIQVPFIQNSAEMWSFRKQMDEGLKRLVQSISVGVTKNLQERALLTGELNNDRFLMSIRDKSSTMRHAPIFLTDGRYDSSFNFHVSRIHIVEFIDGSVIFTSALRLEEGVSFTQTFKSEFLTNEYHGVLRGGEKFLQYVLRFSLNLETGVITLENALPDCAGEISVDLSGMPPGSEWFATEVKRNLLPKFQDAILPQIHAVLSGTFRVVTAGTVARSYLPKWSYARDFRSEFDLRIGENDEDSVDTCDAGRIQKLEERSRRFSKLIRKDGNFNDRVPDAQGKYFTHVSGLKNFPIRFTSTKTQAWYFEQDLRLKMNEYVYKLLNTSANIIKRRNLANVKMPGCIEPAEVKLGRDVRIRNCWIHGLTPLTYTGVDVLEFDQKLISLWTNILAYKNLRFSGEYVINGPRGTPVNGKINITLPSVELSFRIDIDYLREKKVKLDYMKLECVGAKSSHTNPNGHLERVAGLVDGFFRDEMVEQLVQIFRRVFEDSMDEIKWADYLPKWDYGRDYVTEIIFQQNVNRFQSNVKYCDETESQKPTLKQIYPGVGTVPFSSFLPKVKIVGLRRSFERQIKTLMDDAVSSMWRRMVDHHLQRFNPLKFTDKGITWSEDSEETHEALVINAIDLQGLTSDGDLEDVDFAYGKNDTIIILYQQSFDSFKITYNLSIEGQPAGEGEHGTAVATADAPKYLLKVRFFLSNSTFSIDEFFLRCLRNLTVTTHGLRSAGDPKLEAVKDSIMKSLPAWELSEVKELLYDMYGYAAEELDMELYTYAWTRNRELFKIATSEDEHEKKEAPLCQETMQSHNCSCNSTVITRGDAPFIGSEAEWWSFSKKTKGKVVRFNREVRRIARKFIREHALSETMIPDLTKNFSKEIGQEKHEGTCWLREGIAGNLVGVNYVGEVTVDPGNDMKITAYLTLEGDLKLRYNFEAKEGKEFGFGRVQGVAKSVIYKMVIGVDKENKSSHIESFDFKCMRDLKIHPRVSNKKFSWIKQQIPDAFRGDFTSIVLDDIKRILEMAFTYGVKTAAMLPFEENWNYVKDYGELRLKKHPMEGHVIPSCEAA